MKRRAAACALWTLCLSGRAGAHRLDEYLQATLIDVKRNRIDLEIQLVPGVAVLPQILAAIDKNRDGQISAAEQRAYANGIVRDLDLRVDGIPARLTLAESRFPTLAAMREGLGIVRLKLRTERTGHTLRFENRHLPLVSVYLVNCLQDSNHGLQVKRQERDPAQRVMELEYSFATALHR